MKKVQKPQLLDREAILGCTTLKTEIVEVPEWNGAVTVRELTGQERDLYEESCLIIKGNKARMNLKQARSKLVAASIVDADGQRLFTNDDMVKLSQLSGCAIDRVYEVASRLSGLNDKDIKELEGN